MFKFRLKRSKSVTPPIFSKSTNLFWNSGWRVVWLGRHPAENVSVGPKDKLI